MNVEALRQKKAALIERMDAICCAAEHEERPLTADESAEFDAVKTECENISGEIGAWEATNPRRAYVDAQKEAEKQLQARQSDPPETTGDWDPDHAAGMTKRAGADFTREPLYAQLHAFPNTREGRYRAYRAGQWILAALFSNPGARNYCLSHGIGTGFALGETTNAAGGFLVPDELSLAIILLREAYGKFRANTRVIPMGREIMNIPRRAGGVTATFTGEATALTESDQSWDRVNLVAKKNGVLTKVSSELAEDAVMNIADLVADEMAQAFALLEDQCGFIGDGTSTYGGINGINIKMIDGSHTAGAVDATSGEDQFSEITQDSINTLMGTLPEYAAPGAKWFISRMGKALVMDALAMAGGGNSVEDFGSGPRPAFMGHEIVTSQVMPKVTTALNNVVMFLFGNLLQSSTMGVRREMRVMQSTDRYFETDEIGIKATTRFDIVNHNLGDTSDAGAIVAMIGNT
jgi:HK97 family phage major capsid protein